MFGDIAHRLALATARLAPAAEFAIEARLALAPVILIIAVEFGDLPAAPFGIMRIVAENLVGACRARIAAGPRFVSGARRGSGRMDALRARASRIDAVEARAAETRI
jgi:hypothetical protein